MGDSLGPAVYGCDQCKDEQMPGTILLPGGTYQDCVCRATVKLKRRLGQYYSETIYRDTPFIQKTRSNLVMGPHTVDQWYSHVAGVMLFMQAPTTARLLCSNRGDYST